MNKALKQLLLILAVWIGIFSTNVTVFAVVEYVDGYLRYTVEDGSVTITGYNGNESEVTVPAKIAGVPVNTIASGAFSNSMSLKKIYLPDTIMTIEEGAFKAGQTIVYNKNENDTDVTDPGQDETEDTDKDPEQGTEETDKNPEESTEETDKNPEQSTEETDKKPEQSTEEETDKKPEQDTEETDKKPEQDKEEETDKKPEQDTEEGTDKKPEQDTEEGTDKKPEQDKEEGTDKKPNQNREEGTDKNSDQDTLGDSQSGITDKEFGEEEVDVDFTDTTDGAEDYKEENSNKSENKEETNADNRDEVITTGIDNSNNNSIFILVVVVFLVAIVIGFYILRVRSISKQGSKDNKG